LVSIAAKPGTLKVLALGMLLALAMAAQGCATRQQQGLGTAQEYAAYGTTPYEGGYYGVNPYAPFMFGFYNPFWYQWPYYYYPYPYVVTPRPYRPPQRSPYQPPPRVAPGPITPRIRTAPIPRMPRTVVAPTPPTVARPIEMPAFGGGPMRMGGIHMGGIHMGGMRR
jgi:hypothetical protein